ncbi:hypothetical protein HMPREF0580_1913 [Mobiluncus mulieris ATCC 35239]|uniref:Uncharacterized protein n=1 Tax=Mobiluncus mulieris ATCC 35239 TaxID=871571 RepID=E0QSP8_9ACTO|nr:hypothetical protein HMPREF0577_1271 [Mobiluncus mulieris ATCC 35243]EFM45412.1 hypothetical protein HMPREF0580_1913 [Mobiluncus mulieris ATCC 35239]
MVGRRESRWQENMVPLFHMLSSSRRTTEWNEVAERKTDDRKQ